MDVFAFDYMYYIDYTFELLFFFAVRSFCVFADNFCKNEVKLDLGHSDANSATCFRLIPTVWATCTKYSSDAELCRPWFWKTDSTMDSIHLKSTLHCQGQWVSGFFCRNFGDAMRCHVFFKSCRWDDFCSAIFSLPYGVRWRSTTSKKERERAQRWGSRRKSRGQGASWNFMQFVLVWAMCFFVGLLWWVLPSFVLSVVWKNCQKGSPNLGKCVEKRTLGSVRGRAFRWWTCCELVQKKDILLPKDCFLKANVADLFSGGWRWWGGAKGSDDTNDQVQLRDHWSFWLIIPLRRPYF